MDTARALPAWMISVVAAVALLTVGLVIWNGLFGFNRPVGHDVAVRPGMYDMQAEMRKPADSYRQRLKDHPPSTDTTRQ